MRLRKGVKIALSIVLLIIIGISYNVILNQDRAEQADESVLKVTGYKEEFRNAEIAGVNTCEENNMAYVTAFKNHREEWWVACYISSPPNHKNLPLERLI